MNGFEHRLNLLPLLALSPFEILQTTRNLLVGGHNSCRSRTRVRIIAMLTAMARLLVSTDDNMAIPCSVKAYGK